MCSINSPCSRVTFSFNVPLGRFLAEFAPAVGDVVGDHLAAHDIQNLVEAGAGIDGQTQREQTPAP